MSRLAWIAWQRSDGKRSYAHAIRIESQRPFHTKLPPTLCGNTLPPKAADVTIVDMSKEGGLTRCGACDEKLRAKGQYRESNR